MGAIFALSLLAAPIGSVRAGVARLGGETVRDRQAAVLGMSALWESGALLLGGSFDGSSRVDSLHVGDVRHSFFAATGGGSFQVTDRFTLQLLGAVGAHRVSGTRFGPRLFAVSQDPSVVVN